MSISFILPQRISLAVISRIHHFEKENRLIVIAADCTGPWRPRGIHEACWGLPFLNEIVGKLDIIHSDMILNRLREM